MTIKVSRIVLDAIDKHLRFINLASFKSSKAISNYLSNKYNISIRYMIYYLKGKIPKNFKITGWTPGEEYPKEFVRFCYLYRKPLYKMILGRVFLKNNAKEVFNDWSKRKYSNTSNK